MIQSNAFNYINVLNRAADAVWLRNEVLANNIANNTTPGYKRQDVDFEDQLRRALGNSRYTSLDAKVNGIRKAAMRTRVYTDSANFSYRLDGNNVDADREGIKLAANQMKYNGLITSINEEFSNLRRVMQ